MHMGSFAGWHSWKEGRVIKRFYSGTRSQTFAISGTPARCCDVQRKAKPHQKCCIWCEMHSEALATNARTHKKHQGRQHRNSWIVRVFASQSCCPIVSSCVRECQAWLSIGFPALQEDTITVSWCGCSFFPLCFTFLSAGAEWVSWACQRTASDGRRNPVCKSHRGDSAAVRGRCWLCFTTAVLSCWQGGVAVHRWCNTGRKCTATHAQSLHPVCARCHRTERHKEEMHFTSHVWRPTRPCSTYR